MGLDELHLRVLATSSEDLTEKRNAQKGVIDSIILSDYLTNRPSPQSTPQRSSLGAGRSVVVQRRLYFTTETRLSYC